MLEQIVLNNGMNLICYKLPHTHSIEIGLYIKVGSAYECEDNNGITHLLEHMHFRRLGKLSNEELYYKTECMGTSLRASTYKNMLRFYMKLRPQYFVEGINIVKMILSDCEWTSEELNAEKQIVQNEIIEKSQYLDIEKLADEIVWQNSSLSYPVLGREEVIKKLKIEDLKKYKQEFFCKGRVFWL